MRYKSILLIFLPLLLLTLTSPCLGEEAKRKVTIKDLTATTSATHLIVFATLENSFTSEMIEILHSGIPLRFTFFIELYESAKNWPDEQIAAFSFDHIMTFDTLKENYRVTLEENNNKVQPFRSLFEAQKVVNEINGVKVVALKQLIPDNLYTFKIRTELYQKTLPMSLHNILPFLSWWNIETEWHTIEFKY